MRPLVIRQRWTPWWIAVPLLVAYLAVGYLIFRQLDHPGQGVRIFVPPFLVLGALILPAALNARIINVGPHGVYVTNGPIPRGRNVTVARDDIRYCNFRVQHSTFRSEHGTSTDVPNYLVGVDTRRGQIDIAYPYLKAEQAQAVAGQIAAALNQDQTMRHISVTTAVHDPDADPNWRRKVVLWFGAFMLSILAGAVWEMS